MQCIHEEGDKTQALFYGVSPEPLIAWTLDEML